MKKFGLVFALVLGVFLVFGLGTAMAENHDNHDNHDDHNHATATPTPTPTPTPHDSHDHDSHDDHHSRPTVTPTPTPAGDCDNDGDPTDTNEAAECASPTPTPTPTTPVATPTAITVVYDGKGDGLGCATHDCSGNTTGITGTGTGGQVLGASTMAGTGTFEETFYQAIMSVGATLSAFGIKGLKKSKKTSKK